MLFIIFIGYLWLLPANMLLLSYVTLHPGRFAISSYFMQQGIIGYTVRSLNFYLSAKQRKQAFVQFILTLISSVLDVFGLAALVPVLLVAAEPGAVLRHPYFAPLYAALGLSSERMFLVLLIAALLVFFILKNIFSTWVSYVQARFTASIGLEIVRQQLVKYLNFPFWYFNDVGSASLTNSTLNVPSAYVNAVVRPLFIFFSELTVILVIVVSIMLYKPLLLLLLALTLVPTALLTYHKLRVRSQAIGDELNRLRSLSFGLVGDLFAGFVELRLANRQRQFASRLVGNQEAMQKLDAEAYLYSLLPVRVIELMAIAGVLTIFLYYLFMPTAIEGGLIALVGLFAAAAYRLMPSVNRMLTTLVSIKQFQYAIENLESFREPQYDEHLPEQQLPLVFERTLAFDNVSFRFPSQAADEAPALQNVSFTVRRGEKIGFIGSSGSGKTTLMNVLLRFYREQSGAVLIDDLPLTPQHIQAWYKLVGYVKQDTFLMEASIQDNITLGAPAAEVDELRLQYAIEQASLTDLVANLPQGLHTFIGERGSKLSGGQRQRIGIARALYKKAEVLLLDEATSALDNETEREVNEAIARLAHTNITILIIAHRLTTLRECDRIYELSHGRLVAERQYAELVH